MQQNIEEARKHISDLSRLASQVSESEKNIASSAEARLAVVNKEISRIMQKSIGNPALSRQYLDLMIERGKLQLVISNSRKHLQQ